MNLQVEQLHPLVLNVGLAVHNADWNWKNVSSPFIRLYYVTEGAAQIELPGGIYDLRPGHMYLVHAFALHTNICTGHFVHYYIHIYEDYYSDGGWLEHWTFPVEVDAGDSELALFRRLCAINPKMILPKSDPASYDNHSTLMQNLLRNRQRPFCDKVESRGIVLQLLARFLKVGHFRMEMGDSRIVKSVLYIRRHIGEPIELEQLATTACLSKDHFIRLFKKEMGITPLQYVNQKKIEKAQLLLLTEDLSVKEVAARLAFDDYSYFNRLFKKTAGITPQEYRRQY